MENVFNERLRYLVENTGMSLHQISIAIGMSHKSLTNYCSGNTKPDFDNLVKLADYFAVPLDYLAGRCTEAHAKEISENYSAKFMALRRAPYEAYLAGRKPIRLDIGEVEEPWPYNLMGRVFGEPWEQVLSEDQMDGIDAALDKLTEREKEAVLFYMKDGMSMEKSGSIHGVTRGREHQILNRAVRKLRHPSRADLMEYGKHGFEARNLYRLEEIELSKQRQQIAKLRAELHIEKAELDCIVGESVNITDVESLRKIKLDKLDISKRCYNALRRAHCNTLGDVIIILESGNLLKIRNFGNLSAYEIIKKIHTITGVQYTPGGDVVNGNPESNCRN